MQKNKEYDNRVVKSEVVNEPIKQPLKQEVIADQPAHIAAECKPEIKKKKTIKWLAMMTTKKK